MRQGQLPARNMARVHDLLAEVYLPIAPGGQTDRANGHLGRRAKDILQGSAWNDADKGEPSLASAGTVPADLLSSPSTCAN